MFPLVPILRSSNSSYVSSAARRLATAVNSGVATSAYRTAQAYNPSLTVPASAVSAVFNRMPSMVDTAKPVVNSVINSSFRNLSRSPASGGGFAASSAPVVSPQLDYYQAALAGHYGMDATTAYQEALSNTSYQRSVQDMLNAGLNPAALFAAGRVSGAQGVGYATQLGSGFIDPGAGAGSARGKYVFSKGMYNALQVVGGGLAVAITKHPASYFPGAAATKGVLQAINGFFR